MKSKVFKVGKLQVELEDGGLRYVSYSGVEIVRGIYAAVRDQDWGTVAPRFTDVQIAEDDHEITINFLCEHVQGDIDFLWNGSIRLMENGLMFNFHGQARSTFQKNRIGFCVLHPMNFAGLNTVIHTSSSLVHGEFPKKISPHQPFKEIQSMTYEPTTDLQVNMIFEGDLFEMEDQRNWTDASYKTYCTPLELPFPVQVEKGQVIQQSIEVVITGEPIMELSAESDRVTQITLHDEIVCELPKIGLTLSNRESNEQESSLLRQLHPSHLRLIINLTEEGWQERLQLAADSASLYGCDLELEVIVEQDKHLDELAGFIADHSVPVLRLFPYQLGSYVSDSQTIQSVRRRLASIGLQIPIGGGVRTYYAEFNRASLPLEDIDLCGYSINPQVHAFDDRSLIETLAAQAVTATDAIIKCGKPLSIGPITFKPRINPNATSGAGISIEDQRDDRQGELFGAAWTLGSIAALSMKNVSSITYYETSGPIGLVDGLQVNPLYYVFKDITEFADASVLSNDCTSDAITALVLKRGCHVRILIANITDEKQEVVIAGGFYSRAGIRQYYDSRMNYNLTEAVDSEEIGLILAPYGYVCIDLI